MTAAELVERLERVKRSGDGWTARCPAHEDREPSLSVAEGDDGRVLLHCHAGCAPERIAGALGLELRDLFPEPAGSNGARRIVARYPYLAEDGTLLFEAVRFEPKGFAQRRRDERGQWVWNLRGVRRVLYRLPELRAAIEAGTAPIYIAEGEKDVHALEQAGAVATCNPMGAGKWRAEYAEQLAGAGWVIVIADDDEPGREHARQVAQSLRAAGLEATVALPSVGKDVSDHLAAGRSLGELVPLEEPLAAERAGAVEIVSLDAFLAEREELPRALVGTSTDAFLPAGGLVIVGGLGGSTKTTFSVDAVAHFASGTSWCGLELSAPLRVLLIENEGPRAFFREKLRAKVEAWAGDPFRPNVYVLRGPWGLFDFRRDEHRGALRAAIAEHEIDLVVADPLTNLGMEGAGTLDDTGKFVRLLRDCGLHDPERPVAFWLLHHLNKQKHRDVLQALSGAWDNWADTIVVVRAEHAARLTLVTWGKVRHGSLPYDEQTTTFRWADGYAYERVEKAARDTKAEVLDLLRKKDRPSGWVASEISAKSKGGIGANIDAVRAALQELETAGEVVEVDPLEAGRKINAHPYRSADSGARSRHESAESAGLFAPGSPADSTPCSPEGSTVESSRQGGADSDPPSRQDDLGGKDERPPRTS